MATTLADRIEEWRGQLLDTSKRNRLVSLNLGRTGAVKLVHPDADRLWTRLVVEGKAMTFPFKRDLLGMPPEVEGDGLGSSLLDGEGESQGPGDRIDLRPCLESPHLEDFHILTDRPDTQLKSRLGRMALNASTSMAEQGVPTLYLTFGLLKWFESPDSRVEVYSPLILFPVGLEREDIESPWEVKLQDEEMMLNHSLAQLMGQDFAIRFPEPPERDEDDDSAAWRLRYFAAVQNAIRNQKTWEILDDCTLGTFSFQKIAMWDDLGKNQDQVLEHDLCRAIAGDLAVRLTVPEGLPTDKELDAVTHPALTYHILDSDSSQHEAIEAAKRGANLIIDGPPGTGKSQTIANVIAEFLATGKTVLFVSEKAAALEVVKRRLDRRGLGDFCLECHSHKANKKQVIEELDRCLNLPGETYQDQAEDLERLFEAREALNAYVRALHEPRRPLDLSAFQLHGRLAAIKTAGVSNCAVPDVPGMTRDRLRRLDDLLDSLADCREVIRDHAVHPWRGIRRRGQTLNLVADLEHHLGWLARGLAAIRDAAPLLSDLGFGPAQPSLADWLDSAELARETPSYPLVPAEWFGEQGRRAIEATIRLDEATRAYRQARGALPEFSEGAVLRLDAEAIKRLDASTTREPGLPPNGGATVRTLCDELRRIVPDLASLADLSRATNEALVRLLGVLGLEPRPLAVRGLGKVKELLGLVGKVAPMRRAWFDAPKRQEVRKVIEKCREGEARNDALRLLLLDRMLPRAFDAEHADLARRAQGYRAAWTRWLPGWWKLRGRLSALYARGAPATPQILADTSELSQYHARLDYAREVKRQYADQLVVRHDGEVDWEGTSEALNLCELFDPILRVFPELKDVLVDPGRVDRAALGRSLGELAECYQAFRDKVEAVAKAIDLGGVFGPEGKSSRMSATDFAEWLGERSRGLAARLAALEEVVGLLKPDQDLALADLPSRLGAVGLLRQHSVEVGRLAGALGMTSAGREVHDRDWGELRAKAEWAREFLDRHADRPPEPLVRAATRPEIRAALGEAVRCNLAARTDEFLESWDHLTRLFDPDQEVSTGIRLGHASVSALLDWVEARRGDVGRVQEWAKFCEVREAVIQAGLGLVLTELFQGRLGVEDAKAAVLARSYRSWLDWVYDQDPILRRFATEAHERQIADFRSLDRGAIRLSKNRIREALLNDPVRPRLTTLDAPGNSELGTLLREVNKKRRHLALRQLFSRIPTVLLRLKPCLMMSPLAVSTYLNTREIRFNVVIFDEASQVRPYDAISAIYRGKQLVVAGDQKQLPPTTFFERAASDDGAASDGEEGEETLDDYESILDVCCTLGLARRRLRWHYRSRREPLIAFSNRHFYDNDLVTFPSVLDTGEAPAVRFEYLADGRWKSGASGGFNAVEARKTAGLVMDHFRANPDQSLGVIAFSQRQQMAILDELERLRRADPAMEGFFSSDREEPFFVKNLENVQGDERHVIFLSVGYGPDEDGRVAMRFGPLNRQGGQRRLNVAVTRARLSMTVVSSMKSHDIDLSRTNAVGAKLLRAYLDFAERGVSALGSEVTQVDEHDFDSPFEKEVAAALQGRGLEVRKQVGCSGYRIDLALVDPRNTGRFVLGVECDGATYHRSATARDRDRLRQEVLESLGWGIVRIWSTDWVKDPRAQIDRVVAAFERRLAQAAAPHEPAQAAAPPERPADELPLNTTQDGAKNPEIRSYQYPNIEEVPPAVIEDLLLSVLGQFGATEESDLIVAVARQLGFQRTGTRIKARISACVERLLVEKRVNRTDKNALRLCVDSGPALV
jgi:very-short-patch-repair endonuclease